MMHVPSAVRIDHLTAARTSARLPPPHGHQSATKQTTHEALFALLEVGFPLRVERIRIRSYLGVPPDGDGG
jgi:hypothetical protein